MNSWRWPIHIRRTGETSGPTLIAINGGNPATISTGTIYSDLGATIAGPQDDINLSIHAFVDGVATDPRTICNSRPGGRPNCMASDVLLVSNHSPSRDLRSLDLLMRVNATTPF